MGLWIGVFTNDFPVAENRRRRKNKWYYYIIIIIIIIITKGREGMDDKVCTNQVYMDN
jgi:hypothetical protein